MNDSVRVAGSEDIPSIAELCAEHARFERAEPPAVDEESLATAMRGPCPGLFAWVAVQGVAIVGYATATPEFSTWRGRTFLYLDCLYLQSEVRGRGLGRRLFGAVLATARERGYPLLEWQTPKWNTRAVDFYKSLGAVGREKMRFELAVRDQRSERAGTERI